MSEFETVHRARHLNIGKHYPDVAAARRRRQTVPSIWGRLVRGAGRSSLAWICAALRRATASDRRQALRRCRPSITTPPLFVPNNDPVRLFGASFIGRRPLELHHVDPGPGHQRWASKSRRRYSLPLPRHFFARRLRQTEEPRSAEATHFRAQRERRTHGGRGGLCKRSLGLCLSSGRRMKATAFVT